MKKAIITGSGTSIWGNSTGTVEVESFKVVYKSKKECMAISQMLKYPGYNFRKFISVDVTGRGLKSEWYTDTEIPSQVKAWAGQTLLKRFNADALDIGWSEYGMQNNGKWNFDVNLLFK